MKIDDEFKRWMRIKLGRDRAYAERIFHALIDEENATLLDVWPHAALPHESAFTDPETMIGLLKGYDNSTGTELVMAIFGKWEDLKPIAHDYFGVIWGMSKPASYSDFESLPNIYEVAFDDLEDEEEIKRIRGRIRIDGAETMPFDEHKINLVNTRLEESRIMRLICGEE